MNTTPRYGRSAVGEWLVGLALAWLAWWLWRWQSGPWPGVTPLMQPRIAAGAAIACYAAFCGWIAWRPRAPRTAATGDGVSPWRVVYASQTGFALELAERTARALRDAGDAVSVHDIHAIDLQALDGARCLFIASTTGEGDPPDHAMGFVERVMAQPAQLQRTRYAVLALGDSEYAHFCAFGRELDAWLQRHGAQPLFDRVEVDNADPGALRHWQHQVGLVVGNTDQPDWTRPRYEAWTLAGRRLLNDGSAGGPIFEVDLVPPDGRRAEWQAGDIAEIGTRQAPDRVEDFIQGSGLDPGTQVEFLGENLPLRDALARSHIPEGQEASRANASASDPAMLLRPLPHREYSIASLPSDGKLQLLVRLARHEDGRPGLGSGWLCLGAQIGGPVELRIRSNPNFHAPDPCRPLVMVGNGTGLAGLLAHLKARIQAGAHRNWLVYGERNAAHDALHGDVLSSWLAHGQLAFLDRVYSRDGQAQRYVQHALRDQADRLLAWVEQGAAIYVCGSLQGMAPAVHETLAEVLGPDRLAGMASEGRYRRDVY